MKVTKTQHIALAATAKFFGGHKVEAGFFETAKYDDGTPVAYIAAIQEFGYPEGNIPSRAFFRNAIGANEKKWQVASSQLMLSVIEGKLSKEQALDQLGALMVGDIQESIIDGEFEPLKQATLDARQSRKRTKGVGTKPLIDTEHMMDSVKFAVEKK